MIMDGVYFQFKKKEKLSSKLLVSTLLEKLMKQDVINYATYQNARKEIKKYDSAISK